MDDELFRLCRSVYEATGWDDTDSIVNSSGDRTFSGYLGQRLYEHFVPLYTSDYLLEKLPRNLENIPLCLWGAGRSDWMAEYDGTGQFEGSNERIFAVSNTPLKSLLKLVLKLHEEKLI